MASIRRIVAILALIVIALGAVATAQAAAERGPSNVVALPTSPGGTVSAAGPYYIVSRRSGRCMNVYQGSTANGADIIQWDCVNADNNKWYLDGPYGDGYYYLQARHSGRCANVYRGGTTNGVDIIQWDCVTATNNQWYFAY